MSQYDKRGEALRKGIRKRNSMMMLKLRVMKIVLNFQINEVPSVLCLFSYYISYAFNLVHIYFDIIV